MSLASGLLLTCFCRISSSFLALSTRGGRGWEPTILESIYKGWEPTILESIYRGWEPTTLESCYRGG